MDAEGLILAGGKSTRMGGFHKGSLVYRDKTFTERLIKELKKEVAYVRLSYGQEVKEAHTGCPVVMDIYQGCGPIGGLCAGLRACSAEWMLAVACDMPFLNIELFRYLMDRLEEKEMEGISYDGAVPVTNGGIHPLAAIYRTNTAGVFEEQVKKGNYRLRDVLDQFPVLYVDVTGKESFERMLRNINTREEYERMVGEWALYC